MASNNDSLKKTVLYGTGSAFLYYLLFVYADQTVQWAALTREGQKGYFVLPIVIAVVFSMVHGAFTGFFWDAIGMKPAKKLHGKK
jgi:hypothetical protein